MIRKPFALQDMLVGRTRDRRMRDFTANGKGNMTEFDIHADTHSQPQSAIAVIRKTIDRWKRLRSQGAEGEERTRQRALANKIASSISKPQNYSSNEYKYLFLADSRVRALFAQTVVSDGSIFRMK